MRNRDSFVLNDARPAIQARAFFAERLVRRDTKTFRVYAGLTNVRLVIKNPALVAMNLVRIIIKR